MNVPFTTHIYYIQQIGYVRSLYESELEEVGDNVDIEVGVFMMMT